MSAKALKDLALHLPLPARLALARALVPEYAVVPKRLTNEMLNAGVVQKNKGNPIPNIWAAMLAAGEATP